MNSKPKFIRDRKQQKQYNADKRFVFFKQYGIKYDIYRHWSKLSGLTEPADVIKYRAENVWAKSKQTDEETKRKRSENRDRWGENKDVEFMELYGFKYSAYKTYKRTHNNASIEDYIEFKENKRKAELERENRYKEYLAVKRKYVRVKPRKTPKASIPKPKLPTKKQAYFELQTKINNLERLITEPSIREPRISKLRAEFEEIYGEIII